MKLLKRILIVVGSLMLLLFVSAFVILRFYEDDVVKYALNKAKSQFTSRVEMGEVELAFWKTFPSASLHFNNLYIEETFASKDTLVFAKSLYLEFNLLDLFRGNYDIHSIVVEDAFCRFQVDAKGEDNWHFWKVDESDSSQFKLDLKKVMLNSTEVYYSDRKNNFILDLSSDESTGEGNFSGDLFDLDLELAGQIHRLKYGNEDYAIEKKITADASIHADTQQEVYELNQCEVIFEKLPFLINGSVNTSDKSAMHLKISGREINLNQLVESLTPSQRQMLSDYNPSGDINLDISIDGDTYGKKNPLIDAHGVLRNGRLKHKPSGTTLDNLSCDLRYTSGSKTDQMRITQLQCNLDEGFLQAKGTIDNLRQPQLNLNVEAKIDLSGLKNFFAMDTLEICQGSLIANAAIGGELKYNASDSAYDWRSLFTTGSGKLENGLIRLKNSNREFSSINGEVLFDKKNATIRNLSGRVNGSDFRIVGALNNLIPFLSSTEEHLQLDAKMYCELIDFTNLVETESSTNNNSDYKFELPARVEFNLISEVKKFVFRKFEATNMKGVALLKAGKLVVDPLSFQTAEGSFTAQLLMEKSSEELYRLNCLAQLEKINIQKLFTEFENFGQTFIQDKHLKGIATATVQFRTNVTTSLVMLTDPVESIIDISIENGELNNLETLQDIAVYLRNNKWVAPFVNEDKFSEKMKNVSFSKLENVVEIKNRLITIPLMDVKSSAMDISARGTHTFDNQIDYAIGFNLRDVLIRKEKEWQETDDGLGKRLYISMKGTTDDPKFSMDKDLAKEVRQDEMQAEKQNVKALLKEELGLFKKDRSLGTFKEEVIPSGGTTTLEWDENDSKIEKAQQEEPKEAKPKVEKPTDQPKKKVPKWLEEKD